MSTNRDDELRHLANDARLLYSKLKSFTDYRKLVSMAQRLSSLPNEVLVAFSSISGAGSWYVNTLADEALLSAGAAAALAGPFFLLAVGGGSILLYRAAVAVYTSRIVPTQESTIVVSTDPELADTSSLGALTDARVAVRGKDKTKQTAR